MSILIVLSSLVGAMIFFAGWFVGSNYRHKEEKSPERSGRKRKPRPPKCAVIALSREGNEELKKKTRKKQSASGVLGSAEFDEKHIKGIDLRI